MLSYEEFDLKKADRIAEEGVGTGVGRVIHYLGKIT